MNNLKNVNYFNKFCKIQYIINNININNNIYENLESFDRLSIKLESDEYKELSNVSTITSALFKEYDVNICNMISFVVCNIQKDTRKDDCKSILEELKLMGIGNGIVRKYNNIITTIKSFLSEILNETDFKLLFISDKSISIIKSIANYINKYGLNYKTFIGDFSELKKDLIEPIKKIIFFDEKELNLQIVKDVETRHHIK